MNTTSSTTRNKRAAWCAGDVAQQVAGHIHVGSPAREVAKAASLCAAGPDTLTFVDHARGLGAPDQSPAGTLLITEALRDARLWDAERTTVIICARPRLAMARLVAQLMPSPAVAQGISGQAMIDPTAQVHPHAHVGPGAVVAAFASVGEHAQVGPLCYVGEGAEIGAHAILHPGAKVLWGCSVGDASILHAGCVIGADGFGFVPDAAGEHVKVPQVGCVVVGERVEVGANTTIDRATFGETRIGAGTKLDNLVQVGHNVAVGEHCLIVSQSGIAGSTTLGHHVVVGAQGGIVGHIQVAPHTQLAARAGVIGSIETPGVYAGAPAMEHRAWLRMVAAQRDLVALRRRVASLAEVMHPAEKAP